MRPTADIALRGIRENLLQVVAPRVTDPEAQRQIQSMTTLLERLADEWSNEPNRLQADNERIVELVDSAAAALQATGNDEWARTATDATGACASAPESDGSLASLYARQDVLNAALVRVLEALEQAEARAPSPAAAEARASIYRFLKTA